MQNTIVKEYSYVQLARIVLRFYQSRQLVDLEMARNLAEMVIREEQQSQTTKTPPQPTLFPIK